MLAREFPVQTLIHGDMQDDGNGNMIPRPGWRCLVEFLRPRFASLDIEASVKAIADMMTFRRRSGESIDKVLARFELTKHWAVQEGDFDLGSTGYDWLLLTALEVPPTVWAQFLAQFGGSLPQNRDQLAALM